MAKKRKTNPERERIPVQYLIIEAAQDPSFNHPKRYGGAQVGCWIKNQTPKNAYLIARGWIEDHEWVSLSLVDRHRVTAWDYKNNSEYRRYYEQALIDSEVFVFFTFPC